MSRIAKADVNKALEAAAKTLITIGGDDGRISRTDVKKALATDGVPRLQVPLVDVFFKFIDNRDFRKGTTVTESDVKRAVTYAKQHMIAAYDLDNNGLSKAEIAKMSLTGKRAVDLAVALKAAVVPPGPAAGGMDALAKTVKAAGDFQPFGEYGLGVDLSSEPKTSTRDQLIAGVLDMDPADLTPDMADVTEGAAAISGFAADLKAAAQQRNEDNEGDAEQKQISDLVEKVAQDAVSAFSPASQWKQIMYVSHSISEDGDMERHSLLAQKQDGSWARLDYTDFPF